MSNKPPRCDSCNRRIRPTHHEFVLRDLVTGQVVGNYHARCQGAAVKYFSSGTVLRATVYHPERCNGDLKDCDGGLSELAA